MAACHRCGGSDRLRYDHASEAWVCARGCGQSPRRRQRSRKRPALFSAVVVDNGVRRRATRAELREAARLYYAHSDIRQGIA